MPTKRRRFLWAAWWSGAPSVDPFRKPDASSGGARSREEARAAAERAAGQSLVEIESRWAGAWARVLRGEPPWRKASASRPKREPQTVLAPRGSRPWAMRVLGIDATATAEDIKRAFRALALTTHPDRGGDDAAFIEVKRAYDVAIAAVGAPRRRRR